jgi:hypothetical protein
MVDGTEPSPWRSAASTRVSTQSLDQTRVARRCGCSDRITEQRLNTSRRAAHVISGCFVTITRAQRLHIDGLVNHRLSNKASTPWLQRGEGMSNASNVTRSKAIRVGIVGAAAVATARRRREAKGPATRNGWTELVEESRICGKGHRNRRCIVQVHRGSLMWLCAGAQLPLART